MVHMDSGHVLSVKGTATNSSQPSVSDLNLDGENIIFLTV